MSPRQLLTLAISALLFVPAVSALAQATGPADPAALVPCALKVAEVQAVFGLTVDQVQQGDVTVPNGRDVACLYTFKNSSFTIGVRQIWDPSATAPPRASSRIDRVSKAIDGDADGAAFSTAATDGPGAGGELEYVRGKVRTRVLAHGGRLTGAEVIQRFLRLRRVP